MARLDGLSRQELIDKLNELEVLLETIKKEKENHELLQFPWVGNLGNWHWYVKSNRVVFNDAKVLALGYSKDEIPSEVGFEFFTEKIHRDDYERVMDNMRRHLYGETPAYETTYRIKTRNAHWLWFYDRGKVTKRDKNGKPELVSGIVFDVSEQKRMEELLEAKNRRLEEMSRRDYLTDLYNRRALMEKLDFEIKRRNRTKTSLSVVMLDLDHFKQVNDTHGHQVGDQVLVQVADLLRKTVREIDIVGRYGGEEFLVILPDCPAKEAVNVAERIRAGVAGFDFSLSLKLTISGGVAEYIGGNSDNLIEIADQNLYLAKNSGRNKIQK
ncbi:MAG: sensor domain-containing diguanylate cyclase [Anaerolineae bacterium]|nr:sensor domain-containing diguanylate cyclase [Anaerolineae bacterium]